MTTGPRLVLGSASPARLSVLRAAGIDPLVRVSSVDEDAVAAQLSARRAPESPAPAEVVTELARAKALDVFATLRSAPEHTAPDISSDAVIVGCDSMLFLDGELHGKPHTPEQARRRWSAMRGRSGELLTGHCVLRVRGADSEPQVVEGHSTTTIRFASPSDEDLDAYVATGEPLKVAGAFTLDGLGGWFIERIEGDPSSVIGIGLPLMRTLLNRLGVGMAELWAANPLASSAPRVNQ